MAAVDIGFRHSARFVRPFAKVLRRYDSVPRAEIEALEGIDLDAWISYAAGAHFVE